MRHPHGGEDDAEPGGRLALLGQRPNRGDQAFDGAGQGGDAKLVAALAVGSVGTAVGVVGSLRQGVAGKFFGVCPGVGQGASRWQDVGRLHLGSDLAVSVTMRNGVFLHLD